MITIDRLKYFVEAAQLEHVGKAAKNMAVSASVISSAIKTLEEEIGCELFIREKNSLRLTEKGKELLERSGQIISATEDLYSLNQTGKDTLKGHCKIAASPFLMKEYLIDAFLKVKKENPKLTSEFISIDTGVAVSQVISGAIDFALVFRSIEHQDIDEEIVFEGNFYVAVKKGHPVLKQSLKKKVELLNELPAITFRTSVGVNFCERHPVFYDLGIKPNHQYFYDNNDTALKLIESTNGWALLPENVIDKYKSKLSKVSLSKDWKVPVKISLIKNKYNKAPRLYQEILKQLKI